MTGQSNRTNDGLPPLRGEFSLIESLCRRIKLSDRTRLGIGDDAAWLADPGSDLVFASDLLLEGRHFLLAEHGGEAVGRKALGVNLSDLAAMAARPLAATVSVALPRSDPASIAGDLQTGLVAMADRFDIDLVGGDTNAWDGPLVINVAVLGRPTSKGPVLRAGARPGDVIAVTGPLGGSLRGRHLSPEPRIAEALAIHEAVPIHAMIDLSDGLASDLIHILRAGDDLGAELDAEAIPIHDDARFMATRDDRTPLAHALEDGEDFELCLTLDPDDAQRFLAMPPSGVQLHSIGRVTSGGGVWLRQPNGRPARLGSGGFDHLS